MLRLKWMRTWIFSASFMWKTKRNHHCDLGELDYNSPSSKSPQSLVRISQFQKTLGLKSQVWHILTRYIHNSQNLNLNMQGIEFIDFLSLDSKNVYIWDVSPPHWGCFHGKWVGWAWKTPSLTCDIILVYSHWHPAGHTRIIWAMFWFKTQKLIYFISQSPKKMQSKFSNPTYTFYVFVEVSCNVSGISTVPVPLKVEKLRVQGTFSCLYVLHGFSSDA